ncbi:MAG: phosphonate metabolism protein/1,5-bisphosphokinase (PRPP-forming) PhnN [Desulfovibrionales bacterium]
MNDGPGLAEDGNMTDEMKHGKLVYVMGPSGAGKDSLLEYARTHCDNGLPVLFAHRYITRPAQTGGENHVALSEAEFTRRSDSGLFALSWESHGFHYGIGAEVISWLQRGFTVVVNGSRQYLPEAQKRIPTLAPVEIVVRPDILEQRLQSRGREDRIEIQKRLQRNGTLQSLPSDVHTIDNSGNLKTAGRELVAFIKRQSQ